MKHAFLQGSSYNQLTKVSSKYRFEESKTLETKKAH